MDYKGVRRFQSKQEANNWIWAMHEQVFHYYFNLFDKLVSKDLILFYKFQKVQFIKKQKSLLDKLV